MDAQKQLPRPTDYTSLRLQESLRKAMPMIEPYPFRGLPHM
jgi:hypothetical protein